MFGEKNRYTIVTTTVATLVIFSVTDIFRILVSDDVLILKKNIFEPPSKSQIINQYLLLQYFERFKKRVLQKECEVAFPKPKGRLQLAKTNMMTEFIKVEDWQPKRGSNGSEIAYLKRKGLNNINSKEGCCPRII